MKKAKTHALKLILWIVIAVIIIIVLGYFLYAYLRMNDKKTPQNVFSGRIYATTDEQTQLKFDEACSAVMLIDNGVQYILYATYEDNIFIFADEETRYEYIVLGADTLFGGNADIRGDGKYLYLYNYDEVVQ